MIKYRVFPRRTRPAVSESVTVGVPLASLWAFHAAAAHVSRAWFLRLPILFGTAAAFLVWRLSSPRRRRRATHKNGVTLGICCWATAATFSAALNWHVDDVPLTYLSVFLAGAAIYVALSGLRFTSADLDAAVVGLGIGTSVPLVAGLLASFGYTSSAFGIGDQSIAFLLIVTPILVAMLVDARKRTGVRLLCALALVPIVLSLAVLHVNAAFMALLAVAVGLVCAFKLGTPRLPLVATALIAAAAATLFAIQPEVGQLMSDRWMPVATMLTTPPHPVNGQSALEGEWLIALRYWLLGTGPGSDTVVAMETGILGLFGVLLLALGVWVSLARTLVRGRDDEANDTRFVLLVGPAAYVTYSVCASMAAETAAMNAWTVLVASMLALMPPFDRGDSEEATASESARPPQSTSASDFVQRPQSIPSLAR